MANLLVTDLPDDESASYRHVITNLLVIDLRDDESASNRLTR